MNLENILTQLKSERDRLDKAISALNGVAGQSRRGRRAKATVSTRPARRRRLSPEGRRRIVEALKRRWAQQRKKAA